MSPVSEVESDGDVEHEEEDGVYIVPITDAEEAASSCGEWGFGMELYESDLPMVSCILDESEGKPGREELLDGMMVGAIFGSNLEAARLLLDAGVDGGGSDLIGESFLLLALGHVISVSYDPDQESNITDLIALADLLVDDGARISVPPSEGYANAWFHASTVSPEVVRIMTRAGMDVNFRGPVQGQFSMDTALDGAVARACWADEVGPESPEVQIVRELIEAGADVNTMSVGQILDDKGQNVIGFSESKSVLSIAEDGDCTSVASLLLDAGACRNLEGRRVTWEGDSSLSGNLKMLSASSAFPPRGDVDCGASP